MNKNKKLSKANILKMIAYAIKHSDKTYFFEDYYEQANHVIKKLDEEGLMIVPKEPTDLMLEKGIENILYGQNTSTEVVKNIYKAMIKHFF